MIALLTCLALWYGMSGPCLAETLRRQLETLAKSSQFQVEGLDRLGREPGRSVQGNAQEQLPTLLQDYNYLLIQGAGGHIERVSITSVKDPDAKPAFSPVISTSRFGTHHQVDTTLTGPSGEAVVVPLLVDTGATTLVLPESMIQTLGFTTDTLRPAMSQTASDTVAIKIGSLPLVQVGEVIAENVEVSFFPDKRLNGAKLLGMSFLNRYRFSLDDAQSELTLIAK